MGPSDDCPKHLVRYPTCASIDKLAARFGLPNEPKQDWEVVVADFARTSEILDAYDDEDLDDDDRFLLMELVVACLDDGLNARAQPGMLWPRARRILRRNWALHATTLAYWARGNDDDPDHQFHVTPLIRSVWHEVLAEPGLGSAESVFPRDPAGATSKLPVFAVERVPSRKRGEPILARLVSGELRALRDGSKLGGFAIRPVLSQPRASDIEGRPRSDLYAFVLSGPVARNRMVEGQRLVLEVPDVTCAACRACWVDPPLEVRELDELRALLVKHHPSSVVHRLCELTGLGLANAKRVLDHVDFHAGHCAHCDIILRDGSRVTCEACGGETYRWAARPEHVT